MVNGFDRRWGPVCQVHDFTGRCAAYFRRVIYNFNPETIGLNSYMWALDLT